MKRSFFALAIAASLLSVQATADTVPTTDAERQTAIYQQLVSGPNGLAIKFQNVHLQGSEVVGSVQVHWQETFFGNPVTLINGDYPFSTPAVENILTTDVKLGSGAKAKIHVVASYRPVQQACIEVIAAFMGGKIKETRCTAIP
ncbi:MAG TPA: hypothetical protein VGG10_18905 [Rhizomicrobium sp.]|jgi:hypothetical protein